MSDATKSLRLMAMLSPAFPVGAFAYSHGLEQVIADGGVRDRESLVAWIAAVMTSGSGWNDAVLLVLAHESCDDNQNLSELALLGKALSSGRARQVETLALGNAFIDAAENLGSNVSGITGIDVPYALAVGAIAGREGFDRKIAVAAFLQAFGSNLVAVAQRLVPLGQADAVRAIAELEPSIERVASDAVAATLDDLGGSSFLSDIASMRHDTLQPRIFRT